MNKTDLLFIALGLICSIALTGQSDLGLIDKGNIPKHVDGTVRANTIKLMGAGI
ncbi:hypothetical protein [Gelidibacter sp.]|uniref:hypothetical protein n=1 Tax=Gelidibacter sp. TaxID=2018083 RepID=UPI002BA0EE43|nr:hypothetical protein [Gelidibacter sp.]HUH27328.1 hypothetical protein [Gelidibacter sp.]